MIIAPEFQISMSGEQWRDIDTHVAREILVEDGRKADSADRVMEMLRHSKAEFPTKAGYIRLNPNRRPA